MSETGWMAVSRDEYRTFVASYPGELMADVCGISEPPLESWSDFNRRSGFEAMVAKHHRGTDRYWIKAT
jgi:hypothetical protein